MLLDENYCLIRGTFVCKLINRPGIHGTCENFAYAYWAVHICTFLSFIPLYFVFRLPVVQASSLFGSYVRLEQTVEITSRLSQVKAQETTENNNVNTESGNFLFTFIFLSCSS
jgi:hypothetical protein